MGDLLASYPGLTERPIQACQAYAAAYLALAKTICEGQEVRWDRWRM